MTVPIFQVLPSLKQCLRITLGDLGVSVVLWLGDVDKFEPVTN